MSVPFAVSRVDDDGLFKINVFVTVSKQSIPVPAATPDCCYMIELWERYFDGTTWQGWSNHGSLPGAVPFTRQEAFDWRIELRTGMVWRAGSTLRINLFGNNGVSAIQKRKLIEESWDGAQWTGLRIHEGPDQHGFDSVSSFVHDDAAFDYLSLIGLSEVNQVWEFYWDSRAGANALWKWRQLND